MRCTYTKEYNMEHGLSRGRRRFREGVVARSGADWKLCERADRAEAHLKSESCERALEEGRGLERQPVAGEAADDLHPQRQACRIKQAGNIDTGCTQKCPEPIEGRPSSRAQSMRR